jgi:hypothetical protein
MNDHKYILMVTIYKLIHVNILIYINVIILLLKNLIIINMNNIFCFNKTYVNYLLFIHFIKLHQYIKYDDYNFINIILSYS